MFKDLHWINVAEVECCGHEIEEIISIKNGDSLTG